MSENGGQDAREQVENSDIQDVRKLPLEHLRLDWRNPRLPADIQSPDKTQQELAEYINKHYDPLAIAESIAQHRFFESEPLIAVQDSEEEFTVIEGNRRLTALMGLADAALRSRFAHENSGWGRIPDTKPPDRIPVLVVRDAEDVAPLLGYRHISGIEPWDPFAQARYIAQLVDGGKSLPEVAELVGRGHTEVNRMYRDYDILRQGEEEFELDVSRAKKAFGVFNNAMSRTSIRHFISAPPPRDVDPGVFPMPDTAKRNLRTLLSLMFGGPRGDGRVVKDSRQLGSLAKVLADPTGTGLRVLRTTLSLEEALDAATDPEDQFNRAIRAALTQMEKAVQVKSSPKSPKAVGELDKIYSLAAQLLEDVATEERS